MIDSVVLCILDRPVDHMHIAVSPFFQNTEDGICLAIYNSLQPTMNDMNDLSSVQKKHL
jgi:hypothetical protein